MIKSTARACARLACFTLALLSFSAPHSFALSHGYEDALSEMKRIRKITVPAQDGTGERIPGLTHPDLPDTLLLDCDRSPFATCALVDGRGPILFVDESEVETLLQMIADAE